MLSLIAPALTLVIAALNLAVTTREVVAMDSVIYLVSRSALADPAASVLSVLAIVVAAAVTRVRGAAGGWVALLVAVALLVDLGPFASDLTANLLHLFGGLLVAVIVGLLALAWKRQVSRA